MLIVAVYANGRKITFTKSIFFLLITDPTIVRILDKDTGATLFDRTKEENDG